MTRLRSGLPIMAIAMFLSGAMFAIPASAGPVSSMPGIALAETGSDLLHVQFFDFRDDDGPRYRRGRDYDRYDRYDRRRDFDDRRRRDYRQDPRAQREYLRDQREAQKRAIRAQRDAQKRAVRRGVVLPGGMPPAAGGNSYGR